VRGYLENAAPQFHALSIDASTPLLSRAFPDAFVHDLGVMWQSRKRHLQTLDRLPQTLIHGDAQQTNLFQVTNESGDPEIAAIDWSFVGVGPLGQDAVQLFTPIVFYPAPSVDQIAGVAQGIYTRYLSGVQAAGWQGDPRLVRLGYTTSMIRASTLYVWRFMQVLLDESMRKRAQLMLEANGMTLEDWADRVRHGEQCARALFQESLVLRDQLWP